MVHSAQMTGRTEVVVSPGHRHRWPVATLRPHRGGQRHHIVLETDRIELGAGEEHWQAARGDTGGRDRSICTQIPCRVVRSDRRIVPTKEAHRTRKLAMRCFAGEARWPKCWPSCRRQRWTQRPALPGWHNRRVFGSRARHRPDPRPRGASQPPALPNRRDSAVGQQWVYRGRLSAPLKLSHAAAPAFGPSRSRPSFSVLLQVPGEVIGARLYLDRLRPLLVN